MLSLSRWIFAEEKKTSISAFKNPDDDDDDDDDDEDELFLWYDWLTKDV